MKKRFYRVLLCCAFLVSCCALLSVAASAASPMSDFDFARYGSDYPDLLRAYGPEVYRDKLYMHYLRSGAAEGRVAYSIRTGQPFELEENALQAYEHQKTLTSVEARLANAPLAPDRNWPDKLLELADAVLAQTGGTTPAEQLRGCYDWLIANCSYGYDSVSLGEGGRTAEDAYSILAGHVGVCDNYSAAFAVMARMLGYDARLQNGQTSRAGGGYTGHAWCVINIHGVDYVFDPQVEDNIAKGGAIRYLRYGKTYEELPGKYYLYADDFVQDSIMASTSNDPLPAYSFGEGGSYLAELNTARAEAGLAPMQWSPALARAAFRIALGEDEEAVAQGMKDEIGGRYSLSSSYGFIMSPSSEVDWSERYTRAGFAIVGPSFCRLYQ